MASNQSTLADEDGSHPDWIELHNPSSQPVSLEGWYLTDDATVLTRWRFPAVSLPPNGFLVVFASGKNRTDPAAPLHTSFSLSAGGEYLALVRPDGQTVASAFAPEYPEQYEDFSYGLAQNVQTNLFLARGASARILVPVDATLGSAWTSRTFADNSWKRGQTGVGFQTAVPGFAVNNFKANLLVNTLDLAKSVIDDPSRQAGVQSENAATINYFGSAGDGHYQNNQTFPGAPAGADIDDFVVEVLAVVTLPQAGPWTFGVNSDDGFELGISDFVMAFPNPRGPADTLGTFDAPAADDYNLRLVFYERGGGSSLELFAAPGNFATWDGTRFRLVGDTANGGLAVRSLPVSSGTALGLASFIQTDLRAEMKDVNATAYLRIPFQIADPQALRSLTLRMRYDDGFVAFLNGLEIARRNAPGVLRWDSRAAAERPPALASQAEEINISDSISALVSGTNILAIHGLNLAATDVDFLALPELVEYQIESVAPHYFATATPGQPNGSGVLAFVSDTKFSHDRGFYTNRFDLAISTATAGATIRYTLDGSKPTQTNGLPYTGPLSVSKTTTVRAAAFKSGFESSNADTHTYVFLEDVIRQSPDGSPPSGWPSSWGANTVDYGMDPDIVNSPLYQGSIKGALAALPSFSVVTELQNLFDPSTGIYANPGQDGRAWERPCSLELIYPNGTKGFQIDAGIRIRGGFSRSTGNPKHAFRFFFRREYGTPKLRYPLFGNAGTDEFDNIDLRTFQNYSWSFQGDNRGVFVRDQFSRDAQLAMGHPAERGNYYHLYVNGQYWGLFNTCERPEASYAETYFGGQKEDYDVIKVEAGPYAINPTDGTLDAWKRLYDLALPGLSSDAAYQRVQGNNPDGTPNPAYENLIDVPNLIDYMLVILYGGNLDAPISNFLGNTRPNNWYGIRNRLGPDGFRFFAHDAEHTLLNAGENRTGPYPAGDTSHLYSSPQWIWQKMWGNLEFRMLVADRVHQHFFNGGVLSPAGAAALFNKRTGELDQAVIAESARWGDAKRATPLTRADWLNEANRIRNNYIPQRTATILSQLRAHNLYPAFDAPSFNQHGGNVASGFQVRMLPVGSAIYYTTDGSDPRLRGGAIAASARLYPGPVTLTESTHVNARIFAAGQWSALNQATFTIIQSFNSLFITEIMYHPAALGTTDGDEFEFLELKNVSTDVLDLSGVYLTNAVQFTFPLGTRLEAGRFLVLVKNAAAFRTNYPAAPIAGVYTGSLDNAGETIDVHHAAGALTFSVPYDDAAPWPAAADGTGFSIVPVNPNLNPAPNDPAQWRASSAIGGSPGADDPSLNILPVWITEALTHTDPPMLDAIELFNPNSVPAPIGSWFLTDNRSLPKKYQIAAGAELQPGEYRVFTETDFNPQPGVEPSFTLSSHGEEVFLYSADAAGNLTGYSDGFGFGAAANGVSFGRHTISSGEVHFPPQSTNSLGAANLGPRIGPVVLNEIQYHPAGGAEEFVELKNLTAGAIPLYHPEHPANTWRLNGLNFAFPMGVEIPGRGLLLAVSGDPDSFRARYAVPESVQIFGPFLGSLQDGGERLQLERPDAPDIDTNGMVIVPFITVDSVRYDDASPWPTNAAGTGSSLERITAFAYGDDPINWRASPGSPSPGFENFGNRPPQVNAGADLAIQTAQVPVVTNLVAAVADDGEPKPPAFLTLTWSQVSGPNPATFSTTTQAVTSVSFPSFGTYVLRFVADDSALAVRDEVTITITPAPTAQALIVAGASWRYLDDGSDQGTAWREPAFSDTSWASGGAQLGYGDDDERTPLNTGPSNNKFLACYFRHAFTVTDPSLFSEAKVRLLRDDGAVVYLNGREIFRSNMPEGDIGYLTRANAAVGGSDESAFYEQSVDPNQLLPGRNVLAVEVHQSGGNSSDLSFDLELLSIVTPSNQAPVVNAGPDQSVPPNRPVSLQGSAGDDGLPIPPGTLTISWSILSGPGAVTFAPTNQLQTAAAFSQPGDYTIRLTATDGQLTATDDLRVTVTSDDFTAWKARYFTAAELNDPAISGNGADPDADGHTNAQEYVAGTDPRDPASVLKLIVVQPSVAATVALQFTTVAGKSYTVQTRTSADNSWTILEQIPPVSSTGPREIRDLSNTASVATFYRIVTPAVP